jgi:hypothetical protein
MAPNYQGGWQVIYSVIILHTLGSENVSIEADCADDALIQARELALNNGFVLLRCYLS